MLHPVLINAAMLGDVEHLNKVQERSTGLHTDRPNLLDKPVLLAVGFVDDEGKLKGGFYLEAVAELCFFGTDPDCTEESVDYAEAVVKFLEERGLRWLRCFPPKALEGQLTPFFQRGGFSKADEQLGHFSRRVTGGNDGSE